MGQRDPAEYIIERIVDRIDTSGERRAACRYRADEDQVRLGWWDGADYRTALAWLMDFSQEGAAVLCDEAPPADGPAWLHIRGPEPTDWVETAVVAVEATRRGPHLLRLRFRRGCPYHLFQAALSRLDQDRDTDEPDRVA